MNAANLFKKQISEDTLNVISKKSPINYRSVFKPPYKSQHLFTVIITLFLFLTIPLTVFVANQVRDDRSKAASGPAMLFEENFKKLDLKFAAKEQKLTLVNKVEDDTLPQPEIDKKEGISSKVVTFEVEQTNKIGQPIFNSSQDVTVKVNDKGQASAQDVYFSVQVQDEPGTVKIKLSDKKLLEVGI